MPWLPNTEVRLMNDVEPSSLRGRLNSPKPALPPKPLTKSAMRRPPKRPAEDPHAHGQRLGRVPARPICPCPHTIRTVIADFVAGNGEFRHIQIGFSTGSCRAEPGVIRSESEVQTSEPATRRTRVSAPRISPGSC